MTGAWTYPPSAPAPSLVPEPAPGTTLLSPRGAYTIGRRMGAGAFGAVFEALGPFDQRYALKLFRPANRPYAEVRDEWTRETTRLFSLRHPNVVYLYDAFEHAFLFYIALERCDHTLADMLGQPLGEGLIVELSRQLLAAVQYLHDNDIVHGDLHPGNVLIVQESRPTVKISDFGISNELRGIFAVRPAVVHHAIMAPEIIESGYTSRQSDLYQLGLVIYWMITGEPAIDLAAPYPEIVQRVAAGEPRKRAEALGTPLSRIVAKMLRRRESWRYAAAREVWDDMRVLPGWRENELFPPR